ncbi:MAG: hypothetical protein AAFU66_00570 [Pseudomonadota bacterium]
MTNHPNRGRGEQTVTLIRSRSGFANVPDTFRVTAGPDDFDDYNEQPETYWLPKGYEVAESSVGALCIYDSDGEYCEIMEHSSGRPQVFSGSRNMPVLKAVSAE